MPLELSPITITVTLSSVQTPNPATQGELSTYWMPLCEPIYEWASFAQHAEQHVSVLTAIGHAFFALSHETRALRSFTLAYQQQQGRSPKDARYWYTQADRALLDATHHWSRAASALDTLTPDELTAEDLQLVRTMSRAARAQQERLWKLTDEVRLRSPTGASSTSQQHRRRCWHERATRPLVSTGGTGSALR